MKKVLYYSIIAILFLACSPKKNVNNFTFKFIQNDNEINTINESLLLERTPFEVHFNSSEPFDLMVNASFDDALYKKAFNDSLLTNEPQFKQNATIAEVLFNKDKGMFISKESTSVWYYTDKNDHKYDNVIFENDTLKCRRIIENIFDLDADKKMKIDQVDKPIYLVFLLVKFVDNETPLTELQRFKVKLNWKGELKKPKKLTFQDALNTIKVKSLPIKETTNFDDFIDPSDYKKINEEDLKIEGVFPDNYNEKSNYKSISNYRLKISDNFHTVVITALKGEHEMETKLVNYDLKGNIIDSLLIAYDEIAEGVSRTTTTINNSIIEVKSTVSVENQEDDIVQYHINSNGEINEVKL